MSEKGKQIASFIALTVAISAPSVIAQDIDNTGDLVADAAVMIQKPEPVAYPVMRYAGPEYFGFGGGTVNAVKPVPIQQLPIPQVQDTAQYMQLQNNAINNANSNTQINTNTNINTVNINNVKPNTNFVNTEYGSVKVLDSAGHYIFK